MESPHATPSPDIMEATVGRPIYSPSQVMAGAFVGGPVGLIYFLRENFLTLGNDALAKKSLMYGAAFIVALLMILPLLPDGFPSLPITIAYMLFGQQIANKYQLTRKAIDESAQYTVQSNWRVLGYSLLCLLASLIVLVVPLTLLGILGVPVD